MSTINLVGRVWKFSGNVSDDGIIEFSIVAQRFGKAFDEDALRATCFRRLRPEFPREVRPSDIVVGGTNFGHHNHIEVSVAMKVSGITAAMEDGEVLEADPATGAVRTPSGRVLQARPFSPYMVIWCRSGRLAAPLLCLKNG